MVCLPSVYACMALAVYFTTLATVADSRMIMPLELATSAFRQSRQSRSISSSITPDLIDSYFASSGFPKAGRTLDQKIREAKAFLDVEVPKTGVVGTGVSIVYDDNVVLSKGYGLRYSSDKSTATMKDSIFQIGSVSKTFIAVGIALLVEEGKLDWRDPVKQHLPWFQLTDKYAEEHVTIGDMLSMNSGIARQPEFAIYYGQFKTEREFVAALGSSDPEFSLREIPQYANTNFEILGVVIEELSGKSWSTFLTERLWKPLEMTHTFAAARSIPAKLQNATTAGHVLCGGERMGPYSLSSSPVTELAVGDATGLFAAGSIVTSADDMATFARFLLNKGVVGNTKLFTSPATLATMMSGKNLAAAELLERIDVGFDFASDGSTLAAGYGFDYIGEVMWGHGYVSKGGATPTQAADLSLAPRNGLGIVILANTQGKANQLSLLRLYVMGIFLDVPKDVLDFQYKKKLTALTPTEVPPPSLLPDCGFPFWKNPPHLVLTPEQATALMGTYKSLTSPAFFSSVSITRSSVANEFVMAYNSVKASYFFAGSENSIWYFKSSEVISTMFAGFWAFRDEKDGSFDIGLPGLRFKKE